MKKLLLICCISLLIGVGCDNTSESKSPDSSEKKTEQLTNVQANDLAAAMENTDELTVQLKGTIVEVCQTSGCWMDIDMGNDQRVLVTFPENVFVTPKDAVGKQATIEGLASKVIIPVKRLQLQAADEGASEEEINAIIEPLTEFSIEATKVKIK